MSVPIATRRKWSKQIRKVFPGYVPQWNDGRFLSVTASLSPEGLEERSGLMGRVRGDEWRDDVPSKNFRGKPVKAQSAPKAKTESTPPRQAEEQAVAEVAEVLVSEISRGDPRLRPLASLLKR